MIYLRTGLPGGGKTLNSLKEIVENPDYSTKEKFYTNIRVLMLDIDVCNSFAGWFYGVFFNSLEPLKQKRYQKIITQVHKEDRPIELTDVPWLSPIFQNYTEEDALNVFLSWVRKLYPASQLEKLNSLFELTDNPTVDQVKSLNYHFNYFEDATKWNSLPSGSVIFIDECQQFFPTRPAGSKRPEHYEKFQVHRHKGYDVHLVTQDPVFLDSHVRNLSGRHVHFYRPFASKYIVRYEHDENFNIRDKEAKSFCRRSTIKRDSNFYGVYWSADEHTHKIVFPKKVLWFIPIFLILSYLLYFIFGGGISEVITNQPKPINGKANIKNVKLPANLIDDRAIYKGTESFTHPLNSMCTDYSYGGFQIVTINGIHNVEHFINCETDKVEKVFNYDEQGQLTESIYDKYLTLSSNYLKELGYNVGLKNNSPFVSYNDTRILLNYF